MKNNRKTTIFPFSCFTTFTISIIAILIISPSAHAQLLTPDTYSTNSDSNYGASLSPDIAPPQQNDNSVAPGTGPLKNPSSPTVNLTNSSAPATNQTPTQTSSGNAKGLVVCTGATDGTGRPICNFNYFLIEMRTVINWLFVIAIPIAIVLFAFGGVLYIIGTSKNRTWANQIFTATGIGFGIMLIAWVSVYTIVSWLTTGTNSSSNNQTGITAFLGH